MLSTRITATVTDDVDRKVGAGIREGIRRAASEGFTVSQEHVPTDQGALLKSGIPPTWTGDTLVWGYSAAYAEFVEDGTEPHWPPIKPLKGWARRVLGDEQAAYAVQATIAEHGTPAQPFVEPGVDAMIQELRQRGLSPFIDEEINR